VAFPDGWGRIVSISVDDAYVDAELTDWTLVLTESKLPAEMIDSDNANAEQDGGGAIRASSDSAGATQLPLHVRAFHPTPGGTGAYADIAVKIPTVTDASPTIIYIWYKKAGEVQPAVGSTYGQYNAYDANYEAVYSLNQDPGPGGAGEILDATSNLLHLTAEASMTTSDLVAGKVHLAHDYDGTDDYLNRTLSPAISPPITIEALTKTTSLTARNVIVSMSTGSLDQIALQSDGDVAGDPIGAGHRNISTVSLDIAESTTGQTSGQWHHAAAVFTAPTDLKAYIDGGAVGSAVSTADMTTDAYTDLAIALYNDDTPSNFYSGVIDEVRISTVARSAAWIKADANNLINAAAMLTTGTPANPAIAAHVLPLPSTYVGERQQSTTNYPIMFFMPDATDLKTGELGLTPSVSLSKNSSAWTIASGTINEVGGGWYALAGHATDRNTLGELRGIVSVSGAATVAFVAHIVVHDPFSNSATASGDATAANQALILAALTAIKGAGFVQGTHALDQQLTDAEIVAALWSGITAGALSAIKGSIHEDDVSLRTTANSAGRALNALTSLAARTNNANLNAVLGVEDASGAIAAKHVYHCRFQFIQDDAGALDKYRSCRWYEDDTPLDVGVTEPKIRVINAETGVDLIAESGMTQAGTSHLFSYTATGASRITNGLAYAVRLKATIDGQVRVFEDRIGRDT